MTSPQRCRPTSLAWALLLITVSLPSYGLPVKWTLDHVTFHGLPADDPRRQGDDGSSADSIDDNRTYTAVGSFVYDAQTPTIVDWDFITAEDTHPQDHFSFNPSLSHAKATQAAGSPDTFTFFNASGYLALVTPPLTGAGGTVQLVGGHLLGASGGQGSGGVFLAFADADLTGGSLIGTVVPEPTVTVGMLSGLAAMFGAALASRRSPAASARRQ